MTTQQEVMPKELLLSAPPTIPQARSYLFKQQSDLQEYDIQKGNKIRINIPRLQRSYLKKDSYLRFRVNIDASNLGGTTAAGLSFDRCGAYGLFDRIEIYDYLGGTLLEQTQNVPALMTLLRDLNSSLIEFNSHFSVTQGCSGSGVNVKNTSYTELKSANVGYTFIQTPGTVNPPTAAAQFVTAEFAIPIPSFLGMFSDKFVPLHNGFSIDLFMNSREQAFIARSSSTYQSPSQLDTPSTNYMQIANAWLSNVEFCCQVLELGDYAESLLQSSEPWVIASKQYRNFRDVISGSENYSSSGPQSNFRLDLNLNVVSLRNLFFMMRPSIYQENLLYPSYGHRIRNFLTNWVFQYGSSFLPEISGISCRGINNSTSRVNYPYAPSISGVPQVSSDYTLPQTADWIRATMCSQAYKELLKTTPNPFPPITLQEYKIDTAASNQAYSGALGYNDYSGALTSVNSIVPWLDQDEALTGKFAGGLNTRLSEKETVSGIDTNGLLLTVLGTFDRDNMNNMVTSILDVFAEFDSFIQVIPGVATTVTF